MEIKKIFAILLLIIMMSVSVNAITMDGDQEDVVTDYVNSDRGNIMIKTISGSISTTQNDSLISGTNISYDEYWEFKSLENPFYIFFDSGYANETIYIHYRGDLTRDANLYSQEIKLNEKGAYIFKFSPEYKNEPAKIYMDLPDNVNFVTEYSEEVPKGFNALIGGFVTSFQEVIDINIAIWEIIFYSLLTLIVLSIISALFGLAFMLFKYTKKVEEHGGFLDKTHRGDK